MFKIPITKTNTEKEKLLLFKEKEVDLGRTP